MTMKNKTTTSALFRSARMTSDTRQAFERAIDNARREKREQEQASYAASQTPDRMAYLREISRFK